jgi:hypothetical protein
MAELYVRKTLSGFSTIDEAGQEAAKKFKLGEIYRAEIVKSRNYKHHCMFLALLEMCFLNQEKYANFRMFRRAVALEAGHVEQLITLDGEVQLIPLSYSYDEIPDENEFTEKFGAAMTVCARMMHNIGIPELEAEVSKYADQHYGLRAA